MRSTLSGVGAAVLGLSIALASSGAADAAVVNKTLNGADTYVAYENVFDLAMQYQFGSAWGVQDATGSFAGNVLTFKPAQVQNDSTAYWYSQDASHTGQKIMDSNLYVEPVAGTFTAGDTLNFSGKINSNTLVAPYSGQITAFIKDFAPDYSSSTSTTVPLTNGVFSISKVIGPSDHHIQYGFEMTGPVAWPGNNANNQFGSIVLSPSAVPEPTTLAAGAAGSLLLRRRRRA